MAGPIVLAAALARTVTIVCPWCKHKKVVERKPAAHRVCPKCHRQFEDPVSAARSAKRRK